MDTQKFAPVTISARQCTLAMPEYFTPSSASPSGLNAARSIRKLLGPAVGKNTGEAAVDKLRFVSPVANAA
jgi:hypothetical protein